MQPVSSPLQPSISITTTVTSYTYDGLGNPLTITRPGNNAVSSITTTLGYTTDGSYSQPAALGQPLTVTDNLGKTTHLRYDAQGNAVGVTDALGNETDLTYTIGNEPLQTVLPATGQTGSGHGGSLVGYLYAEPSSFATTAWPAAKLQYGPATTGTVYDEAGNAIRQTVTAYGPGGATLSVTGSTEPVSYTYDALYRPKTLTDGGGHTTSYFYNAAGYLAQVVYPGAGTPTAPLSAGTADTLTYPSYDGAGNVLSRTDGNGVTTTYTYADPESALTDITYPSGTIGNVHLAYDAYGRRASMSDGTGSQTYAYDDDDALTSKTVNWDNLSQDLDYTYYPDGSRHTMTADGRAFSYAYDAVGRMNSLTNPLGEQTLWSYRDNGWLQEKTLLDASGKQMVDTAYTQNPLGQVTELVNQDTNGDILSDFSALTYDGAGNRRSVTASLPGAPETYSGTTSYQYDYGQSVNPQLNRSQVTGETSTRAGGYTNAFAYDGGTSTGPGNPTSFKGVAQTFNADNQHTGSGFGYDGNGNPTAYRTRTLAFDPENRLTLGGKNGQTNAYSGDALRSRKQFTSGTGPSAVTRTVYFLYDGDQPVLETTQTSSADVPGSVSLTTFGADGLVSRHTSVGATGATHTGQATNSSVNGSETTTFYAFDERGNVSERLSVTASGSSGPGGPRLNAPAGPSVVSEVYDAYGARTGTAAQPDPFGYEGQAGYYTDLETGLILCTHRFYDPQNGRWLTRDPMGYKGGVNLYGYVGNDPVSRTDRRGYQWSSPGDHDGTSAEPTRAGGDGHMPVSDDPTITAYHPQDPGNPGSLRGPIPIGAPGMMPGGVNGESHADCKRYDNRGDALDWLAGEYNGIATGITNGINTVRTGVGDWYGQNFGPDSDLSNGWRNTFDPTLYHEG